MFHTALLYFENDSEAALKLATLANVIALNIKRHNFPDGEIKLRLSTDLPKRAAIFHTLDHPNEKLIELLLAAKTARLHGVKHLTLIAPYLAYMRQDKAFVPGESISQSIVGNFIASLFDAVITVDPHLHRISTLKEAIPVKQAISISACTLIGEYVSRQLINPLIFGPDIESEQWVRQAAANKLDYAVGRKQRSGDSEINIQLPLVEFKNRSIVILDDIASSGNTIARSAELLLNAGAARVDVAVTHALFCQGSIEIIYKSGISNIWSTDCISHVTNAISVLPAISQAWQNLS